MILARLHSLLQTRPLLATELYNELRKYFILSPVPSHLSIGSSLRVQPNQRTPSPVPLSILLELIVFASVNLSVAPFESWHACVECVFCDYERLTETTVERFPVYVPCDAHEFDQFCSELALCGRYAVELLRESQISSPSRSRMDSSEYSEAESDSSDSSVSGEEMVSTIKHSSRGSDNVLCENKGDGSDDD